eukprot:681696_1
MEIHRKPNALTSIAWISLFTVILLSLSFVSIQLIYPQMNDGSLDRTRTVRDISGSQTVTHTHNQHQHMLSTNSTPNTVSNSTAKDKTRILIMGYGHSATSYIQQFIGDVLLNKRDVFYPHGETDEVVDTLGLLHFI